jgi:hypothetical protein
MSVVLALEEVQERFYVPRLSVQMHGWLFKPEHSSHLLERPTFGDLASTSSRHPRVQLFPKTRPNKQLSPPLSPYTRRAIKPNTTRNRERAALQGSTEELEVGKWRRRRIRAWARRRCSCHRRSGRWTLTPPPPETTNSPARRLRGSRPLLYLPPARVFSDPQSL